MAIPTILTGLILIAIGTFGYMSQDPDKASPTAGIPAVLGLFLAICGVLVLLLPKIRKHVMHAAATLGLIGAAGSPYPIIKMIIKGVAFEVTDPKFLTAAASTIVCVGFVVMCANSFVQARKARKLAAAA